MEWVNAAVQGILLGGLYALLATGLSLVFGVMRLVNLAHGDLGILAAFFALVILEATRANALLSLAIVVPFMMLVGYVLQRGVLNRTLEGGVLPPLLATFGLAVVIQNGLLTVFTADSQGLDAGAIETASLRLTDQLAIGWLPVLTLTVAIVVLGGLQLLLDRTQLGRVLRATADDAPAARLMGINDRHIFAVAMAISLGTVAIGGVFLGIRTTFGPFDGPARLIFAFEAVIIGGLGSLWGTLVGGIVLGVAQTVGNQIDPAYQILAGHLVFLAILVIRPTGLFPRAVSRAA
ncbi:MAG TPA: branched-chain amino acid ABC transporter permease [Candidatus Limnocylindrales bacterium]|nr:branched-chain amino acid ABC transporter permease [Candidatus Limnocylindrales bacterium]